MKKYLILLILLCFASTSLATTYYVGQGGDDARTPTQAQSSSTPWATLSHACSVVAAGTAGARNVIAVKAGSITDNSTCTLPVFVNMSGAGKASTGITTSASTYINAVTSVPVVDGGARISGIAFTGSGSNTIINSTGRSNLVVHDCTFTNGDIQVYGKIPYQSTGGASATWNDTDPTLSVAPLSTDWATGFQFYNNTLTNSNLLPGCIKDSYVHDNLWNNTTKSCFGHTAYYVNNLQFYNNTLNMTALSWTSIAIEVWQNSGGTRYHHNATNGWFSIVSNTNGPSSPLSWEIDHNVFKSNTAGAAGNGVNAALESNTIAANVDIHHNYFENTGSNLTYSQAWSFHGRGTSSNFRFFNNVMYNMGSDDIALNTTGGSIPTMAVNGISIFNNVIDAGTTSGAHQGVYMDGSGPGTMTNINIKNNIIIGRLHGALTIGSNFSNISFNYNIGSSPSNTTSGSGFISTSNNINASPGITATGARPDLYYAPVPGGNLIDAGVNVGLPFVGGAPEIGVYELPAVASTSSYIYDGGKLVQITSSSGSNAVSVQGIPVDSSPPASGDVLQYDGVKYAHVAGGGGTQVNSDWNATSGAAQILNKPVVISTAAQIVAALQAAFPGLTYMVSGPSASGAGLVPDTATQNAINALTTAGASTVLWRDTTGAAGSGSATLTGQGGTGAVGNLTASATRNVTVTLVAQGSTGAVGTLTVAANGSISVTLTGQGATGGIGTLTASAGSTVALTGQSGTAAVGTLTASGGSTGPALPNLSTYTAKVDPNFRYTIGDGAGTNTKVTVVDQTRDDANWLAYDFGAGHFGDFEIRFTYRHNSTSSSGVNGLIVLSNTLVGLGLQDSGLGAELYSNGSDSRIYISELKAGPTNAETGPYMESRNTVYYATMQRIGTTCTIKIYSDLGRTTLLNTITATGVASTSYRYLSIAVGNGTGGPSANSYYIDNVTVVSP